MAAATSEEGHRLEPGTGKEQGECALQDPLPCVLHTQQTSLPHYLKSAFINISEVSVLMQEGTTRAGSQKTHFLTNYEDDNVNLSNTQLGPKHICVFRKGFRNDHSGHRRGKMLR